MIWAFILSFFSSVRNRCGCGLLRRIICFKRHFCHCFCWVHNGCVGSSFFYISLRHFSREWGHSGGSVFEKPIKLDASGVAFFCYGASELTSACQQAQKARCGNVDTPHLSHCSKLLKYKLDVSSRWYVVCVCSRQTRCLVAVFAFLLVFYGVESCFGGTVVLIEWRALRTCVVAATKSSLPLLQ